jgi:hypothetical protein
MTLYVTSLFISFQPDECRLILARVPRWGRPLQGWEHDDLELYIRM